MNKLLLCCVITALAASPAWAGGQLAGDNGSQGTQRAGAFVAKADDPSALYYNPAALYKASSNEMFFGINVVSFSQSFQRSGEYAEQNASSGDPEPDYVGDPYPRVEDGGSPQPIPSIAVTIPAGKLAVAFGVFAPHGYGRRDYPDTVQTANSDSAPAPQRYDAVSQKGVIAFPSVGASYEVNDSLSIGGRASWGYARVQTRRFAQGLPNRAETPARDTDASVDVTDNKIMTFGLGAHYHASETFEVGVAYNSAVRVNAVGTSNAILGEDLRNLMPGEVTEIVPVADSEAQCAPGGAVGAIKTCIDFALPQTAMIGVRWIARNGSGDEIGDIEVDARWEDWSAVDEQRVVMDGENSTVKTPLNPSVVRHGYKDVLSIRVGGSTRFVRDSATLELRAGAGYETAATPESWTRLDVDTAPRFTMAGGIGIEFDSMRLDLGLAYINSPVRYVHNEPIADTGDMSGRVQPDITAPLQPPDQQPYHPFNAGVYESSYLIGSVGLTTWW